MQQIANTVGVQTVPEKTSSAFTGTYFQWIKEQLSDWEPFAWALYGFGMGMNLILLITGTHTVMDFISFVAVAFGFLCTVAMAAKGWRKFTDDDGVIKKKLVVGHAINGVLGAVSVVGYIIVNAYAHHWFSVIDQLIFFFAIDLGLMINWRTWGRSKEDAKIKLLNAKSWLIIIVSAAVLWGVLYPLGIVLNDSQPLVDSLVLSLGAVASFLYLKRYEGTYWLWVAANLANIVLWGSKVIAGMPGAEILLTMALLYMASSIYGRINFNSKNNGLVKNL